MRRVLTADGVMIAAGEGSRLVKRRSDMQHRSIYIEDEIYCERAGPYESFEAAVAELRRRAGIAWDAAPNQPPCTSWRTCGREYVVLEYDARRDGAFAA
jgi:hypothetical protein